jgi:hypothetical protein
VQRAALEFVEARDGAVDAFEVAAAVYAVAPTVDGRVRLIPSQVTAVRRALAGLVRRGEIRDMGRRGGSADGGTRHGDADRYEERVRATFGKNTAIRAADRQPAMNAT